MAVRILPGDCRATLASLPAASVQCAVTSPPYYGLRDYGHAGQIGMEATPDEYVAGLVEVFGHVRRVLRDDGTLWLNLGDCYATGSGRDKNVGTVKQGAGFIQKGERRPPVAGHKPKDLLGIPWLVAFALREDGWFLRAAIVWAKPNPMPESVEDRPTSSYEMVFLLAKAGRYFYDAEAIAEPFADERMGNPGAYQRTTAAAKGQNNDRQDGGFLNNGGGWNADGAATTRNARNVWAIATQPYAGAHFATMPPDLAERCIRAGSRPGDTVLDPFGGAGTTGLVADRLQRHAILCELNPTYAGLARERIIADAPLFAEAAE